MQFFMQLYKLIVGKLNAACILKLVLIRLSEGVSWEFANYVNSLLRSAYGTACMDQDPCFWCLRWSHFIMKDSYLLNNMWIINSKVVAAKELYSWWFGVQLKKANVVKKSYSYLFVVAVLLVAVWRIILHILLYLYLFFWEVIPLSLLPFLEIYNSLLLQFQVYPSFSVLL